MTYRGNGGGWLSHRSVSFWTVVGGIAAVLALLVAIWGAARPGAVAPSSGTSPSTMTTSVPESSDSVSESPFSPPPSRQAVTYIADIPPIDNVREPGPVDLSGVSYAHSVFIFCWEPGSSVEWNVGGVHASRLEGMVGIGDDQDASGLKFKVSVYGDDRLLKTLSVSLAHPEKLDVDVRGVTRLRVSTTRNNFTYDIRPVDVAIGDARLNS
jgi:NPCBM/NEW2 domain